MPWARRVLLKSAFTPFTGYGQDGLGLAIALARAGYDVTLSPTVVQPPLPPPVAAMLTKPIEPPYDLLLNHADPESLGLSEGERRSATKRVAWTMWEFTDLGAQFDVAFGPSGLERTIEDRLDSYDTVLVYDDVTEQALGLRTKRPLAKLQGGYFADDWKDAPKRDWSGTFRFCMVGALHARKNPWVAVEAFKRLKARHPDWDVELHMKTNVQTLHPQMEEAYPGLKIHYETWPQRRMLDFYSSCHCLLAPSWGEGKNLPALEAQTTGMPVIATNFGGHAEWMDTVEAWSVKYGLEAHDPEHRMYSARADAEHLTDLMEHAYLNREEARQKGELAAKTIPAMLDWSRVIQRLGDVL